MSLIDLCILLICDSYSFFHYISSLKNFFKTSFYCGIFNRCIHGFTLIF